MNDYIQNKLDELVGILAEKEHDRWAHWQKYMHERVYDSSQSINPHLKVIPTEDYNRWERQLNTPYSELSEKEKESDRKQVRKYLPIIEQVLTDYHNHTVEKWEHDIKLLKLIHKQELDSIALKSLEDFMEWSELRKSLQDTNK